MRIKNVFLIIGIITNTSVLSQTQLDNYIQQKVDDLNIHGLSACLIKDGKMAWINSFGFADIYNSKPVTPNTIFMLASISKTITGTALMQLHERGYFTLEEDVNNYLPFSVNNPNYLSEPITFFQLLTHTSSIRDNWFQMPYTFGDPIIPLGEYLEGYFTPGGTYYSPLLNFYNYLPSSTYNYSNIGVTLCGYLVESITGIPFNQYCNDSIFTPLCMDNTGWFLSEIDTNNLAHPYGGTIANYTDYGFYGYLDYPDGLLKTSVVSLAKFLNMHMHEGYFDGEEILSETTAQNMHIPHISSEGQGLVFYLEPALGSNIWGHNGGDSGVSTDMYFSKEDSTGIIILSNSDNYYTWDIALALFSAADTIDISNAIDINCNYSLPIGIQEQNNNVMTLYPNPTKNQSKIIITDLEDEKLLISLYNSLGKEIPQHTYNIKIEPNSINIMVSNLSAGIYQLKISNKSIDYIKKMVVLD